MAELFEITIQDMIGEVERELRLRQTVYPRRISERKMRQSEADRHMALMRAVLAKLKEGA